MRAAEKAEMLLLAGKVDAEVFRALLPADSTAEILEATSRKKDALFVRQRTADNFRACDSGTPGGLGWHGGLGA